MKKTQEEKIYDYIKINGSITDREAVVNLGIGRLASRIFDMKQAGMNINKVMQELRIGMEVIHM